MNTISPISKDDLLHLGALPQLPSKDRMEVFKKLSNQGKDGELITKNMSQVPYGWATFGGGSAVAAGIVLANRDAERAEKIAQLPINEQKAIAFESGRGNKEAKAASLEKFPELKTAYQAYDEAVAVAFKKFPEPSNHNQSFEGQYGGQSEAGSKRSTYIFQHAEAISNVIKNGLEIPHESQPEKHSSAAHILEQELARLNTCKKSIVLNRMAENVNTNNHALQQNLEVSKS